MENRRPEQHICTICGSCYHNIAFKGGYICENCINVFRTLGTAGRK
ncbi:MAG: hypothetical protein Q4A48_00810 [Bacillota bacterium]|nr:hypothetical protein [Bacillota bacterium]MBQ2678114.1 hypothetical protein [Bacillota bacterium]MBR2511773.1 hypothetical protein [Bacillota bacterium]MDO4859547.1 hypothetical protein [Bacillota bacterium]